MPFLYFPPIYRRTSQVGHYASLGPLQFDTPRLTLDVQIGQTPASLLILVTGQLSINGDNPLNFSQSFQLVIQPFHFIIIARRFIHSFLLDCHWTRPVLCQQRVYSTRLRLGRFV
jgi:hypothetical protein